MVCLTGLLFELNSWRHGKGLEQMSWILVRSSKDHCLTG